MDQEVEHVAVLIHCLFKGAAFPRMVSTTSSICHLSLHQRIVTMQFIGRGFTKREAPFPDHFTGEHDPSLNHQFLNISIVERKVNIQPNTVTNNLRREEEPF